MHPACFFSLPILTSKCALKPINSVSADMLHQVFNLSLSRNLSLPTSLPAGPGAPLGPKGRGRHHLRPGGFREPRKTGLRCRGSLAPPPGPRGGSPAARAARVPGPTPLPVRGTKPRGPPLALGSRVRCLGASVTLSVPGYAAPRLRLNWGWVRGCVCD